MMGRLYESMAADFEHADGRGKLFQLVHEGFQQVNILETKKGVIRGGHYHKISKEAFFIIRGRAEVTLKRDGREEKHAFGEGDFFLIHPYTVHSMYFPEESIMAVLYDVPVEQDSGHKDIYQEMQN